MQKVLYDFCQLKKSYLLHKLFAVFSQIGRKEKPCFSPYQILIAKLGLETFKEMVEEELKTMRHDPQWEELIKNLEVTEDNPKTEAAAFSIR